MITLKKLAFEAMRLEYGEQIDNDESQLSTNYVILLCRQASNKFLAPMIFQKMAEDDRSGLNLVIAQYTVSVTGTNPNKSIALPEFYMHLPFNRGLHGIAPVDDPTNFFIPRHNPSVSRNLPCADLEPGQYSYWTVGLNVYFDETMDLSKVLLYLCVASPDSIGVDDSLPIYPEMQWDIIALVRQMMRESPAPLQERLVDPNFEVGQTNKR